MAINALVMPRWKYFSYNGHEIDASVDAQEAIIIDVASGKVSRIELSEWIGRHMVVRNDPS